MLNSAPNVSEYGQTWVQCRDDNLGTTRPIGMGQTQMDREFIGQQNGLHGDEKYVARAEWCAMPVKTPVWDVFTMSLDTWKRWGTMISN